MSSYKRLVGLLPRNKDVIIAVQMCKRPPTKLFFLEPKAAHKSFYRIFVCGDNLSRLHTWMNTRKYRVPNAKEFGQPEFLTPEEIGQPEFLTPEEKVEAQMPWKDFVHCQEHSHSMHMLVQSLIVSCKRPQVSEKCL